MNLFRFDVVDSVEDIEGKRVWVDYLAIEKCRQCREFVQFSNDKPVTICNQCWQVLQQVPRIEDCRSRDDDSSILVGSAVHYDDLMKKLIHRLKYQRDRLVTVDLVLLLQPVWWQLAPSLIDTPCLVPVPLHWTRRFGRGFNQSELIANMLGDRIGLNCASTLLRRTKRTKAHHGLGKAERFVNVESAFEAHLPPLIPRSVVLVDDVFTSGATLLACASVLKQAGVKQVTALSVARA